MSAYIVGDSPDIGVSDSGGHLTPSQMMGRSRCDVCGIYTQLETHPCGARVCPGCWDRCTDEMSDDAWDRWALREAWSDDGIQEEVTYER